MLYTLCMARDDPQINIRMPAALKAGLEEAASANNRSVTAEIVARLEQSMIGPKHPPTIMVRLEALPYGSPPQEVSLGTFFENFGWTIRTTVEALKEVKSEERDRLKRANDGLGPTIDESPDDAYMADRAAVRFKEHLEQRRERARLKRLINETPPTKPQVGDE